MALWDVKGKALGLPVCRLIGSPIQSRVAAMGSIVFDLEDLDWTLGEFAWMREQGYRIVKGGWGMRPEAVFGQDRDRDLELVRRIRETIGNDLELVVDTPGVWDIWDVPTAIQRFRDLEPYRLKWIEQPLLPRNLEGHARLRRAVATAIGTGEDEWDVDSYARLIDANAVDVVQMDRALPRDHRLPWGDHADRGREPDVERAYLEQRPEHGSKRSPACDLAERPLPRSEATRVASAARAGE